MNKKYMLLYVVLAIAASKSLAHPFPTRNAADIRMQLEKLKTLGSVLYFAAHPDDENTRLITWLANEKHYRTAYLSLTRGDGGQNLIGTEQAEELGLIRTQELLAARRLDGGEQFFSRANDFGFSKTAEETLSIWDKEKILADAVWVIRKFRPDVIITRFPPDARAGHGHHQASAMLAKEAFVAAADAGRFPEQLAFVKPWQAKRLLWNTFSFGNVNTTTPHQFNIAIGQYNALLGKSYGEIAAESRSSHLTQGFGSGKQRGKATEYFEALLGHAPTSSLMEGIDTTWNRVKGGEILSSMINQLNEQFDILHPENSVDGLIALLNVTEKLDDAYWREEKTKEITNLILACAGLWMECYAPSGRIARGERIPIVSQFIVQNPGVKVEVLSPLPTTILEFNELTELRTEYTAEAWTQPYWLDRPHGLGTYVVDDQQRRGLPENKDKPHLFLTVSVNGKSMTVERPIMYKYANPAKGEIYEPLVIAPSVTVNFPQKAIVFNGKAPKKLEVTVTAQKDGANAQLKAVLPPGWRAEPAEVTLQFKSRDEEQNKVFSIYPADKTTKEDMMGFEITEQGKTLPANAIHRMAYDHIPAITWFPESKLRLSKIDAVIAAKRIGYIAGAGDLVASSLRELGLQVDQLSESDILNGSLSAYDAVVTGVRLYNINERMRLLQPYLLDYVKQGGTLLIQYNVNSRLTTDQLGPYPFTISRDRVTEENAEVTLTNPQSAALNFPNKITAADFEGWIQERGLYFADNVDSRYEQPLQMHDKGEAANKGSLIIAPYGSGKFVYTSLAFFRQLPAGVPGAYRLFINLLAKENNN